MTTAAAVNETETTVKGTSKKAKTSGDVFLDAAQKLENMNKEAVLKAADKYAEDVELNYFYLGGALSVILQNAFFEGAESFDQFVGDRFGFKSRKARYLIDIYNNLVGKSIPWETVRPLGWTKLKDLAPREDFTAETAAAWVEKALPLTVLQLQAMLKGETGGDETPETEKGSDDVTTLKFKVHGSQLEVIKQGLSKAKGETQTEHDNEALANICLGYLGGSIQAPTANPEALPTDPEAQVALLKALMQAIGAEKALDTYGEVYPEINIVVKEAEAQ